MYKHEGVKPFVDLWTEHLAELNRATLKEFFNLLKDVPAQDVGPGHLQVYTLHLQDQGRTPAEVGKRLNRVRMFLAFCIAHDLFSGGKALRSFEESVITA